MSSFVGVRRFPDKSGPRYYVRKVRHDHSVLVETNIYAVRDLLVRNPLRLVALACDLMQAFLQVRIRLEQY